MSKNEYACGYKTLKERHSLRTSRKTSELDFRADASRPR